MRSLDALSAPQLDKERFLDVNKASLLDLIGEVNSELNGIDGARLTKISAHDVWVLTYIEQVNNKKVDPNFQHSEGERGLLPLPSDVRLLERHECAGVEPTD